jgi:hypothetical protein
MKNTLLLLFALLVFSCEQETPKATPPITEEVVMKKRNNNGNGNNPTPTPITLRDTIVKVSGTWGLSYDTSICGYLIFRWNPVKPLSTDSTKVGNYGLYIGPDPYASGYCSGYLNTPNTILYYLYGAGCALQPDSTYKIGLGYSVVNYKNYTHTLYLADSITVRTGRGIWQCPTN